MLDKARSIFSAVPTPVAGLALGIASLGLGIENSLPLDSAGQILGASVSLVLVCLILIKFMLYPTMFADDLRHPVLGSILPTLSMAMMLQSKSLALVSVTAAEALWLVAVALHLTLLTAFIFFRAHGFRLHQMVPSWFVPFVGISIAAITVPSYKHYDFAYLLMVIGLVNYAIMLPFMFYRLVMSNEIADPVKPTIAIMAAPASLSLVAYLSLEPDPSLLVCSILLGIAMMMTAFVYLAFFKLLRLPFTPAFAGYTFPMAVGASALYKVADRLAVYPSMLQYSNQIRIMATLEMVVATIVVCYVCFRYLAYYTQAWMAVSHAKKAAKLAHHGAYI